MIHTADDSPVVVTSRTVLAVVLFAFILCPLVLVSEVASQGWTFKNTVFAALSLVLVPYAAWTSTFEVSVERA
jgi:hypothetical protein